MLQPSTEQSLADWEDEGGTSRSPALAEYTVCQPSLPPGYSSQVASGFVRLDQERSYWSVTWPVHLESGEEAPASRWMSYAQTRTLGGPPLGFARFASMVEGISRRRNEIIT